MTKLRAEIGQTDCAARQKLRFVQRSILGSVPQDGFFHGEPWSRDKLARDYRSGRK
jgi:hypothetical protein